MAASEQEYKEKVACAFGWQGDPEDFEEFAAAAVAATAALNGSCRRHGRISHFFFPQGYVFYNSDLKLTLVLGDAIYGIDEAYPCVTYSLDDKSLSVIYSKGDASRPATASSILKFKSVQFFQGEPHLRSE